MDTRRSHDTGSTQKRHLIDLANTSSNIQQRNADPEVNAANLEIGTID